MFSEIHEIGAVSTRLLARNIGYGIEKGDYYLCTSFSYSTHVNETVTKFSIYKDYFNPSMKPVFVAYDYRDCVQFVHELAERPQ